MAFFLLLFCLFAGLLWVCLFIWGFFVGGFLGFWGGGFFFFFLFFV